MLFAGDLLENGAVPWFGDGYPLDWPETAFAGRGAGARRRRARATATTPDRAFADAQAAAIAALAELARRVHAAS